MNESGTEKTPIAAFVVIAVIAFLFGGAYGQRPIFKLECEVQGYLEQNDEANTAIDEHNAEVRSVQESVSDHDELVYAANNLSELDVRLGDPACE